MSPETGNDTPRPRSSAVLIVSLCLNVALIGLIAIGLFRFGFRGFEPPHPGGGGGLNAQMLMRMFPAEQGKLEAIAQAHRPKLRMLRLARNQARAEAFQVLSAPGFDSDAFAKALAAIQTADAAFETEQAKETVESVAALTPAERQSVAEKLPKPNKAWLRRAFRHR
jgi:uncharacterized membrane protein